MLLPFPIVIKGTIGAACTLHMSCRRTMVALEDILPCRSPCPNAALEHSTPSIVAAQTVCLQFLGASGLDERLSFQQMDFSLCRPCQHTRPPAESECTDLLK
jgi:hypothetical protein